AIPQATDFLVSEENVHTAIVYGVVTAGDRNSEEKLVGSLRTTKITMDPDEFIKEAFGTNASGAYFGGGKVSAGGFEVPLGFLAGDSGPDYQDLKWQVYDMQIKQKIFAKIGVKN
ncbi:MAG: bifunctional oligoribonuclease/PAP phosphatase NrnA, partial [Anaerolineae bacterium]